MLSFLLQEMTLNDFYCNHWDTKPLLIRGYKEKFTKYYSISEFESRVTENDLRYPQFQLAKNGKLIPPDLYTISHTFRNRQHSGCINIPAVYKLWNEGATVILQSLQLGSHSLSNHLHILESELNHRVQANAYLTPKESQGFDIHYDTHDLFVLQIEGKKKWRVWENSIARKPLKNELSSLEQEPEGELFFDGVLHQGDLLYIPSGHPHMAITGEETSLHLTIGIHIYRKIDALNFVFKSILRECEKEDSNFWRNALSPNYKDYGDYDFDSALDNIIENLRKKWGMDAVYERFNEDRRPLNQHLFSKSLDIDNINLNTNLHCHAAEYANIIEDGNKVILFYLGRKLILSKEIFQAISSLIEKKYFIPNEIVEYSEQSRLLICKHLLREGFIKFEDKKDV
jgi:ribosomal protein L16 Arg81 hydroxylase